MPTYLYSCLGGHETMVVCRIRDYTPRIVCARCEGVAHRVFTAPTLKIVEDCRYLSPIDDRPITSYAARQEDLKRNHCVPYDPGMKDDHERRKREKADAFYAAVGDTVRRTVSKLPKAKRAQLKKEIINQGLGLECRRSTPVIS